MAKVCSDCRQGVCAGVRYKVFFTTQLSFTEGTSNCLNERSFWEFDATGIIGGLSFERVIDRSSGRLTEFPLLVLTVSGAKIPVLDGDFQQLLENSAIATQSRQTLVGECNFRDFFITSIELVDQDLIAAGGIKCNCTGGDEKISCAGAEGGICCIPKNLLDQLCAKL